MQNCVADAFLYLCPCFRRKQPAFQAFAPLCLQTPRACPLARQRRGRALPPIACGTYLFIFSISFSDKKRCVALTALSHTRKSCGNSPFLSLTSTYFIIFPHLQNFYRRRPPNALCHFCTIALPMFPHGARLQKVYFVPKTGVETPKSLKTIGRKSLLSLFFTTLILIREWFLQSQYRNLQKSFFVHRCNFFFQQLLLPMNA